MLLSAHKNRLIIGISGASGSIYGKTLLEILQKQPVETHLVVSEAARRVGRCFINI